MVAQQPLQVRRRARARDTHVRFRQVQWVRTSTEHSQEADTNNDESTWIHMQQDDVHGSTMKEAHVDGRGGCDGREKTFVMHFNCKRSADVRYGK